MGEVMASSLYQVVVVFNNNKKKQRGREGMTVSARDRRMEAKGSDERGRVRPQIGIDRADNEGFLVPISHDGVRLCSPTRCC
ncbi:hypothetical protein L2E82_10277 [Cichorium intybus]|uniref:Uncharacterized protein n=1 Tax=Cichorium intybus TaxID=13427 RepID=A0ACB9GA65_CICIN|nr:hypothetical protein L2E82_10277 [Cichorium intybus]